MFVKAIKEVVLNKEERREVKKAIKAIRKIKMPKKCYFKGFKEAKN